MQVLFEK